LSVLLRLLTGVTTAKGREAVNLCINNLGCLEAVTPEEKELWRAKQVIDVGFDARRISTNAYTHDIPAIGRPVCAGCGATPLKLKSCTGTCKGAGKFCSADCFARSWKEHRKTTGCRKREEVAAADAPPPAAAATSSRASGAASAAPKAVIKYVAHVSDGEYGHEELFKTDVEVAAGAASLVGTFRQGAAESDIAKGAFMLLVRDVNVATSERILALAPWRCFSCGSAAPPFLLNNVASYMHVPPPDGPLLMDFVFPYCTMKGPCERACRREAAALHAEMGGGVEHFEPGRME